jgi:DNA-binding LacI/PurR family transcriptional regulator
LEGLAQGARRLGYDLQIFIEDMNDRDALLRLATDRFVRGMFFLSYVQLPVLAYLDEYQTPWIGVNWRHRQLAGSSYVWTDFAHAGLTLAGHLFDQGCRRVLAFDWLSAEYGPYEEGLTQAVYDRNLPYAVLEIKSGHAYYDGPATVQALRGAFAAGQAPDGLVLGSAAAAIPVYRYLQAEQPQCVIGRDIKLVCFDDFDKTLALAPGLTGYAQNFTGMGEAAIERMVADLEGQRIKGEQCVEGMLQVRESSVGDARTEGR